MQKFNAWPLATALLALSPMASSQTLYGVTEIGEPDITSQLVAMQPVVQRSYDMARTKSVAMSASGVVEIGEPDMDVPLVKQSGSNKTLPEALRAILPKDWHAKKNASVDRSQRISWNKGSDWLTVLNEVATAYRLSLSVDWDTRTVTVLKQEPAPLIPASASFANEDIKPTKNAGVFTVSEEKWNETKSKSGASKSIIDPPAKKTESAQVEPIKAIVPVEPVKVPAPTYDASLQLIRGESMSKCFENWTNKVGWNLVWSAKLNYIVPVTTTFAGTVEEIANQFENSARQSRLKLHIEGRRQNRTIQITD